MAPNDTTRPRGDEPVRRPVVLVVEDEPPLIRALQRLLRPHFEVLAARNPTEARVAAAVRQLDLILTDFQMPGENGVEGLRSLRDLGHRAPALIVTATVGAEVHAALRAGLASGVVEKPWEVDALLSRALELAGRAPPAAAGQRAG